MINVQNISKHFGETAALRGVSFEVQKGEVLGFLGPNGAGKSTTMRIITCYMPADAGTVSVAGFDVYDDSLEVRRRLGYLPENAPLYHDMKVTEFLGYIADIRQLDIPRRTKRIGEMVEVCGLEGVLNKNIAHLSRGYRQRVGLAQSMLHDPDILILDEPTSGLDPLQIISIRKLIASLAGEKTIIFSTHILQEVGPVTDRVVIINEGKLIADGNISGLVEKAMGENRIFVTMREAADEVERALRDIPALSELRLIDGASDGASRFELRAPFDSDLVGDVARLARERAWDLGELHESRYSLEDTFIALTRAAGSRKEVTS